MHLYSSKYFGFSFFLLCSREGKRGNLQKVYLYLFKIGEIGAYNSVITKKTYTYYSAADIDKFNQV